MNAVPNIADRFAAAKAGLPGGDLPWLVALRAQALERFTAKGLPTPKTEAWKYTNLAPLAKLALVEAKPVENGLKPSSLSWLLPSAEASHRLVFVNGRLRSDLSSPGKLPAGVALTNLAAALANNPTLLDGRLGALADAGHPTVALNTAFMADGFVLRIGRGVTLERPLELLFVAMPGAEPAAIHTRGFVLAEAGSKGTIVERHIGIGSGAYFSNVVTEIALEAGAAIEHYKLQAESAEAFHLATHKVSVGKDACYDSFVLATGGRLARTEIGVNLDGPGASCRLDGAYMGRARQLIDNTTNVEHASPHTTSRQTYKGALDDYARGVFQGRVLVHKDAQKTDGQQTSRTLLLSPGAEIDTKPQLEIYADDVKCSHGAAAGELDEDALFYLRSRGIPEAPARHMLVEAFLDDVVDGIALEAVREAFRNVVTDWLAAKDGA